VRFRSERTRLCILCQSIEAPAPALPMQIAQQIRCNALARDSDLRDFTRLFDRGNLLFEEPTTAADIQ
jgi:hypothetical protein